jgi:hypothetical protein
MRFHTHDSRFHIGLDLSRGVWGYMTGLSCQTRSLPREFLTFLGAWVLAIVVSLPLPAHSQGKPENVRIAYPTISITLAPLWIAKDKGLFEQEGLNAEPTYIRGGTTIVQAVIGGNVHRLCRRAAHPLGHGAVRAAGDCGGAEQ